MNANYERVESFHTNKMIIEQSTISLMQLMEINKLFFKVTNH